MRDFDSLALYLPAAVAKAVAAADRSSDGHFKPIQNEITTVCLFCDVSGFTSLTEKLCNFGPVGLEGLAEQLNKFITQLVKLTSRSGGDVLKFAGDAMMAFWPPVDPKDPKDLTLRVQRAVQCAVDIQLQLDNFAFSVYEKNTEFKNIEMTHDGKDAALYKGTLRAKLGLGFGKLRIMHLGGNCDLIQRERFEYVALGPALMEAIASETVASPGETIVSKEIWDMVGRHFNGKKIASKRYLIEGWKNNDRIAWKNFDRSIPHTSENERKLWKYVPNAVMPYLTEGGDAFWAPELRTVTTLFFDLGLNIQELGLGEHAHKLEQVFYEIQGILLGYEGTINKFLIDDKGSTLIAVFGLPPFAHENDPLRGILSGLKILWMLSKYKLQGSVGISTGLAFCGIIGHAAGNRREYSVIGSKVNLAARLLGAAKERPSNFLIDKETKQSAKDTVLEFIPNTLDLKNIEKPVQCYQISSSNVERSTPDYHSVQMARLSELSKFNVLVLDAGHKQHRQKTRRRGTKTAVSTPNDMKKIEELQVKAMNNTNNFLKEKRQKAQQRKQRHDAGSLTEVDLEHASALVSATANFKASEDMKRKSSSRRGSKKRQQQTTTLTKIKYRSKSSSGSAGSSDEVEFTLTLDPGLRTVRDLLEGALHYLSKKGYVEREAEPEYFELLLQRDDSNRQTLKPNLKLSSLPQARAGVHYLLLIRYEKRRHYSGGSSSKKKYSREHVLECLGQAEDHVLNGKGGKVVLLEGEHGVGKTRLVESFLLNRTETADDELLIGYARGNPFEAGRNSRPFSIWEHLINCLLDGGKTSHSASSANIKTLEQQIAEAVKEAKPTKSRKVPKMSNLYLLNTILLSQFDDPNFMTPEEGHPQDMKGDQQDHLGTGAGSKKSLKKSLKKAKAKNSTTGSSGKSSRVKNLTSMFGGSSEALGNVASAVRRESKRTLRSSTQSRISKRHSSRASMLRLKEDDRLSCDSETKTIINLLASIIGGLATKAPVILVVDEANYMDTFSYLVFQELTEHWMHANIFVVLLHRFAQIGRVPINASTEEDNHRVSVFKPSSKAMQLKSNLVKGGRSSDVDDLETSVLVHEKLKKMNGNGVVEYLELHPDPSETKDFICNYAKVDRCPDELVKFLQKKTKGNPLYICDAVQKYLDDNLLGRHSSGEKELYFPNGEFERLLNVHQVPVPFAVESISSSTIDKMNLRQQLIVKVAAVIGEVFTLDFIRQIYPLRDLNIDKDFEELIQIGFISKVSKDQDQYLESKKPKDKEQYQFTSGWIIEVILKRMLAKQKLKLQNKKKQVQKNNEKEFRNQYMLKAQDALEVVFEGFLHVKKENPRSVAKPWKPRWCRLKGNTLTQYYDKENPKRLEVIILTDNSSVRTDPIGYVGDGGAKLHCFIITTSRWEKKNKIRTDSREFTLACDSENELQQWMYRVQYQIDLIKLRQEAKSSDLPQPPDHRGSTTSTASQHRGAPKVPSKPPSGGEKGSIAFSQRPSVSTVASDSSKSNNKSKLKGVFKRRKSLSGKDKSKIEYGVALQMMTPEDFKAIRQQDSLNLLWSQGDKSDPMIPPHTSDMYFSCCDMSIVSRNSANEIDGYLMGKLQSQRRTHIIGLITACAVLPKARRKGIGRRLYQKFAALCRGKACRFVRVIIPREHSVTIAFHRSLGFEEDDYSTELLARADGGDRVCFIKDLDASSAEKEDQEDFIEVFNPMHSAQKEREVIR